MNNLSNPLKTVCTKKGVTLIEIAVALVVCSLVSIMIVKFFSMTGNKITKLSESVPLQQQVEMVSEAFSRSVRQCNHVTAGTSTSPPATAVNATTIKTRDAQGDAIDTWVIANNTITMNGENCLLSFDDYINTVVDNSSTFKLSVQGKSATLSIEMYKLVGEDKVTVPPIEEEFRCRQ